MAFEYSSQSQSLIFPNPLKRHNYFLLAAAGLFAIPGCILLLKTRGYMTVDDRGLLAAATVIGFAMIAAAISYLAGCMSQLRFFFGRGRPQGLAQALNADAHGTSIEANAYVKETLRQQAIEYSEPKGPIAGLLYTLVPNLIYAPLPLRRLAEWQFRGATTLLVLLMGLSITLIFGASTQGPEDGHIADWIGAAFLLAALWTLVRPIRETGTKEADNNFLTVTWISGLIVFAILGPIALSIIEPNLPDLPFLTPYPHVFVLLIAGIMAHAVFFAAVLGQLLPAPPTAVSVVQDTWNLSCSPALITGEFLRSMQEGWRENIPNRRYIRIEPKIDLTKRADAFAAEIIEETQPFPKRIGRNSAEQISPSGSPILTLVLDAVGVLFVGGAALSAYLAGLDLLANGGLPPIATLYAISCWALGTYALNTARRLWLRFDFESRIYWLEAQGQYVSARVDQGNVLQGNLRSSSSMVQVEGMTFRLWVAELHTVTFGKDARRHIIAMAGNPEVADGLTERLKSFVGNQAAVVALGNAANAERLATNAAMAQRTNPPASIGNTASVVAAIAGTADPDGETEAP